ncbi:DNA polymerase III subunit delta [Sodalis-like endosymbiont of Proechinophthirus fluctus]|uniref:DNA polymerase III subunit delta n=1 Tax=Sodalis-like endosymbiont of Proechinophthirus fluctus TaxID=1462730 RepID=UPI0007A86F2A|nr:DNA polymerase III subunit delta [Sodalis-like endosymbiont of Proechinophthirus fluctus]KYP96315.1 DNA polymerase III subunit delta [Sodalis-like endosymbiont of Proechinophthirus fluctus]
MIRLYAEQLGAQLQESLRPCYLLFGNDPLLLQESQDCIHDRAQEQQFDEHFSITLDASTDWDAIFSMCQERSLFASRQTLLLVLPDGGIHAAMGEKLLQLASLLHEDLLLILHGRKLTRALANTSWFKALSPRAVLVSCATPEQGQLPRWVARRAKNMKLALDDAACQLLCYCYEGNLLALAQALERLSLIYPGGSLTLPRVDAAVNDAARFTPCHWVDAALEGKSKRAAHILRQLQLEAAESVILLRSIQREVLQLLMFKRQMAVMPMRTLFDHYKVWQNRRPLLTKALERLTLPQLRDAIALMTRIELALKQDYSYPVWSDLNALALLLCGKTLPAAMLYG